MLCRVFLMTLMALAPVVSAQFRDGANAPRPVQGDRFTIGRTATFFREEMAPLRVREPLRRMVLTLWLGGFGLTHANVQFAQLFFVDRARRIGE